MFGAVAVAFAVFAASVLFTGFCIGAGQKIGQSVGRRLYRHLALNLLSGCLLPGGAVFALYTVSQAVAVVGGFLNWRIGPLANSAAWVLALLGVLLFFLAGIGQGAREEGVQKLF